MIDGILDNDHAIVRRYYLFLTTTSIALKLNFNHYWALAFGIGQNLIDSFFGIGAFFTRKFWGEKKIRVNFTQGEVISPNILTTDTTANSPAKIYFGLEYPVKTTLSELEYQISRDLKEILESTDLLGTEGAPVTPENIKASTHKLVSLAFGKSPSWFYLYDQKRVQENSYHLKLSRNDPFTGKIKFKLD